MLCQPSHSNRFEVKPISSRLLPKNEGHVFVGIQVNLFLYPEGSVEDNYLRPVVVVRYPQF